MAKTPDEMARQMLQAITPLALGEPQNVVLIAAVQALEALLRSCTEPAAQRRAFANMAQVFVAYAQAEPASPPKQP